MTTLKDSLVAGTTGTEGVDEEETGTLVTTTTGVVVVLFEGTLVYEMSVGVEELLAGTEGVLALVVLEEVTG